MLRVRIWRIVAVASALAAVAAPVAHASTTRYSVTAASGYERVYFSGTPASGCAARGDCGVSGTVVYQFGGAPTHSHALVTVKGKTVTGLRADFTTSGVTTAIVTTPASSTACTATVAHRSDSFRLSKARRAQVTFALHVGPPDYLATSCQGPLEADLARAGALPSAPFKASGFAHPNFTFGLKGSRNFRDVTGFEGTVSWKLTYGLGSGSAKRGSSG